MESVARPGMALGGPIPGENVCGRRTSMDRPARPTTEFMECRGSMFCRRCSEGSTGVSSAGPSSGTAGAVAKALLPSSSSSMATRAPRVRYTQAPAAPALPVATPPRHHSAVSSSLPALRTACIATQRSSAGSGCIHTQGTCVPSPPPRNATWRRHPGAALLTGTRPH
jgi:hypothetical protein